MPGASFYRLGGKLLSRQPSRQAIEEQNLMGRRGHAWIFEKVNPDFLRILVHLDVLLFLRVRVLSQHMLIRDFSYLYYFLW